MTARQAPCRRALTGALLLALLVASDAFSVGSAPMGRAIPLLRSARAPRPHPSLVLSKMSIIQEGSEVAVVVATGKAVSTGPPAEQQAQPEAAPQYQYYEEQPAPMGEMTMQKGHVNKMVLGAGVVAAVSAGYFGVKGYKARQQSLVDEFAQAMMLYWGDEANSKSTIKEYKGKIGPIINGFHKKDMFKSYVIALAEGKPLSINSLRDFETNAKALGISKGAASAILIKAGIELVPVPNPANPWDRQGNRPSVLGKLLWLTERVFPDPKTIAGLRSRFPSSYGNEVIDVLQNTLTEQAYKDIVNAAGGPENGVQPGFAELGYTAKEAEQLVTQMIEEKKKAAEEAARLAAEKAEEERILKIREQAWKKNTKDDDKKEKSKDESSGSDTISRDPGSHEYECTKCGFTLFVAKGREFKFFGDNFKCSQCGAGKEAFKDNSLTDPSGTQPRSPSSSSYGGYSRGGRDDRDDGPATM